MAYISSIEYINRSEPNTLSTDTFGLHSILSVDRRPATIRVRGDRVSPTPQSRGKSANICIPGTYQSRLIWSWTTNLDKTSTAQDV